MMRIRRALEDRCVLMFRPIRGARTVLHTSKSKYMEYHVEYDNRLDMLSPE